MNFDHFIIVRFNLNLRRIKDKEAWLNHRLKFFRAFTAPTLEAQTNKNFTSIFMVDENTPEDVLLELEGLGVIYKSKSTPTGRRFQAELREHFPAFLESMCSNDYILTSRLDSDDGLSKDFVNVTQDLVRTSRIIGKDKFYTYTKGISWLDSERKFFRKEEDFPPFASRIEFIGDGNKPRTILSIGHGSLGTFGKHRKLQIYRGDIMWLQALHDRNLSNNLSSFPGQLGKEVQFRELKEIYGDIKQP